MNVTKQDFKEAVLQLAKMSFLYAKVDRAVYFPDGITPESDTDHTVMLSLICCAYAQKVLPNLDIGKVAQLALVHDVVEVYAGDSVSYLRSEDESKTKAEREAEALIKISGRFDSSFPWLTETIKEYERLDTPESRYVKTMDKLLPIITYILNDAKPLAATSTSKTEVKQFYEQQTAEMVASYAADLAEVMALRQQLTDLLLNIDWEEDLLSNT